MHGILWNIDTVGIQLGCRLVNKTVQGNGEIRGYNIQGVLHVEFYLLDVSTYARIQGY